MTTTTPIDKNDSENRPGVAEQTIADIKFYIDLGLDTEGRAHFLEETAGEIVVTATDRRGKGVRDSDIVETIAMPDGLTVDDYCHFVAEESDVEWVACSQCPELV